MFIRFLAPLVAIIFSVSTASAQIYQWSVSDGGNGHYFEFVQQQLTWSQANAAAQLRTFNGVNGHLATDTSAAETAFFESHYVVDGEGNLTPGWLGGYQDPSAPDFSEPAGGWRWITGEPFTYTNWFPGLPDNSGASQNYIRTQTFFRWDDFQDVSSNFTPGYYVEYAPEPAAALPVCLSLILLRRKRTDFIPTPA